METKIKSVLILTHIESDKIKLPHLDWLIRTNPNVEYHIIVGEDSPKGKQYNWKNGDKPLRKWWKENSDLVNGEGIAVIEWDTLVGIPFPNIPEEFDLVGKQKMIEDPSMRGKWRPRRQRDPKWQDKNWMWWNEATHFNLSESEHAVGLVSFGAFFMRRWILDSVCDPKWDTIYELSMQNELRFPTIAHLSGARIGQISLPFVNFCETKIGTVAGIYHGVKTQFFGNFKS